MLKGDILSTKTLIRHLKVLSTFLLLVSGVSAFLVGTGRAESDVKPVGSSFQPPALALANEAELSSSLFSILDRNNGELRDIFARAERGQLEEALILLRNYHRAKQKPSRFTGSPHKPVTDTSEADKIITEGFRSHDCPPFPLKIPINWEADPYKNRSWRYQFNTLRLLDPLITAYERTRDRKYLAFATDVAVDWSSQHIGTKNNNEFAWYDMAVGLRAARLAYLTDMALRDETITDRQLTILLVASWKHMNELSNPDNLALHSNHGLYQLGGLLALTHSLPELKDSSANTLFAKSELSRAVSLHFSREGMHLEHSPDYHYYTVELLGSLIQTGWLNDCAEISDLYQKAVCNTVWLTHPNGNAVRLGDTNKVKLRHVAAGSLVDNQLVPEGSDSAFKIFSEAGYAIFRPTRVRSGLEDSSFLFFSAAFHSRVHKHADELTFEWSEDGIDLVIDAGKYAFQYADPKRKYVESTRAHNVVEIDNKDYSRHRQDAFGSALTAWGEGEGTYFVEAFVDRARFFDTRHRRVLVFSPGKWLVIIDLLRSSAEHEYTQWFHFNPDMSVSEFASHLEGIVPGWKKKLVILSLDSREIVATELIKGRLQPRYQGWTSFRTGSLTPNYALGYTKDGQNVVFITLMGLVNDDEQIRPVFANISDDGNSIDVMWQQGRLAYGFEYRIREGQKRLLMKNAG